MAGVWKSRSSRRHLSPMPSISRTAIPHTIALFTTQSLLALASAGKLAGFLEGDGEPVWTLLIALAEIACSLLLGFRHTRVTAGRLTAVLGGGFIAFQVWSKTTGGAGCNCFGALTPTGDFLMPAFAVLLLIGGVLSCNSSSEETGSTSAAGSGSIAIPRWLPFAIALLVTAWLRGDSHSASRQASHGTPRVNLMINEVAPVVELPQDGGRKVTIGGASARWRIYAFVQEGCLACIQVERQLRHFQATESRVEVIRVVNGRPVFGITAAFASGESETFTIHDPDGSAARAYCDQPARFPFSVLVSPEGRIRAVLDGFSADTGGVVSRLRRLIHEPLAVDFLVSHRDGRNPAATSVQERRKSGWRTASLLTFVQQGCAACEDLERSLDRLVPFEASIGAGLVLRRTNVVLAGSVNDSRSIRGQAARNLAKRLNVTTTPTTVLLTPQGNVLLRIDGAVATDVFQDALEPKLKSLSESEFRPLTTRSSK